jgi:Flp pilus assembly pilin Flp
MNIILNRFWNDQLGSSVVDWAILGAGVVSLGVALVSTLA